jgi:hypothetical protein
MSERGVVEQRADRRQAHVARRDAVVTVVLEVLQERADQLGVEIVDVQLAGRSARVLLGEGEQQTERVAVGVDGVRAGLALALEAFGEERLQWGFSPLVSDIDLALVIADPVRSDDDETILAVASAEKAKGSALSERLSVSWSTPSTLRGEREGGRFPALDRLDLLQNGRLLAGTDVRSGLARPSANELLISGAEYALTYLAGMRGSGSPTRADLGSLRPAGTDAVDEIRFPEVLISRGVRRLTKLVLFPVRFLFTAETGQVGTNEAAVTWYLADAEAPSRRLAAAALHWRSTPPTDDEASAGLLREQMVTLYLHYVDDHITRLSALGQVELATAFQEWRSRLVG